MKSIFTTKLALNQNKVEDISLNISRNYLVKKRNKIFYKPISFDKTNLKRNQLWNSLKFNNFLKTNQKENNYSIDKKTPFSLDIIHNNKLNNKFQLKAINCLSTTNINHSNISKIKNSNYPNFKLLRFNSSDYSKEGDYYLSSISSQNKIDNQIVKNDKLISNNKSSSTPKKKSNKKNSFRNNNQKIKLSLNTLPEENNYFKTQRILNEKYQISMKKSNEIISNLYQKEKKNRKDIIQQNISGKKKKKKRNKSVENMVKRVLYGTSQTIQNTHNNNNNNEKKITISKMNIINFNNNNKKNNSINAVNSRNNVNFIKPLINKKPIINNIINNNNNNNNKLLSINNIGFTFSNSIHRKNLIKQFPTIKLRKKNYRKFIIEYFTSEIKNNKINDNKDLIKKSKLIIEQKLSSVKSNQLSVKNPYKDIYSSLKEIKTEFISNIPLFNEENYEEYFLDNKFIHYIKENCLIKCFQILLKNTYFDYKEKLLEYLFYGENPIKNHSMIKKKFTKKSVIFIYHVDFEIENQVFMNRLYLRDNIGSIKIKENKFKHYVSKRSQKHIQNKISNLLINKEENENKSIAFNFKRIENKLENFSVLSNKNNLKRDNSNIIKNNKLNSDSIFRSLSFFVYHNDLKKFELYFENFKDSFNIEKTDNKYNTLLTLSVKFHSYEIFKFLIEKGANINTQNIYLNTPLHYAFASKLYKYIDLLISKGANENLKNIYGQTCFECIKVESE